MPKRDPYRALARDLEGSLGRNLDSKKRHPLHLTGEEWRLIIEALDRTAKPYASRKPKKPAANVTTPDTSGGAA